MNYFNSILQSRVNFGAKMELDTWIIGYFSIQKPFTLRKVDRMPVFVCNNI